MKFNRKSIIGSLGIVSFLLMSNFQDTYALGSRVRAMGGAFIGLANDENAIFTNPAGLSQLSGNHYHVDVLLNSRNEFTNDSFAYASQIYEGQSRKRFSIEEYLENEFQFTTNKKRTSRYNFAVSISRDQKSKGFIRKIMLDKQSNSQLGQQVAADTSTDTLNLGFATRFPVASSLFQKNQVFGGVNLKYVRTKRELTTLMSGNNKDVLNVGLSALVKTPHNFSFGMTLDSIISEKLTGDMSSSGSSTNLALGMSYQLDKSSIMVADVTNVLNTARAVSPQFKIGFERQLIQDELFMRLGSWDGTFTMGFGIKLYDDVKVDYAFFNGDVLKEHYISAAMPF